jgi:hypothetical protein
MNPPLRISSTVNLMKEGKIWRRLRLFLLAMAGLVFLVTPVPNLTVAGSYGYQLTLAPPIVKKL